MSGHAATDAGRSTLGSAAPSRRSDDLLRAARWVLDTLERTRRPEPAVPLPSPLWRECERLENRITRATNRGWEGAARRLHQRLLGRVVEFQYRLGDVHRELGQVERMGPKPTLASIYADLAGLRDEFGTVRHDRRSCVLAVTTERILLGDHDLGPFEIVLHVGRGLGAARYEVIALDPSPSSANQTVTHPHVEGNSLCEGEGLAPIRQALDEGRMFDFFLVVASILRTYNPESAYVSLDDWDGTPCHDCGISVSGEDHVLCHYCGVDLCTDCYVCCDDCDVVLCAGCATECRRCGGTYCDDCLTTCVSCSEPCCEECLDEQATCENCREEEEEEAEESDTAADAVRVGEAPLPA